MVEIIDRKGAGELVGKAFKALAVNSMKYRWKKGVMAVV